MIDHTGVIVGSFEASRRFFAAALAPLGYELLLEFHASVAGFGEPGKPDSGLPKVNRTRRESMSRSAPILVERSTRSTRRRWAPAFVTTALQG